MRRFFLRLANLFRRRRAEREMSREIEAHLALLQDQFERQGMPHEDARRAARRAYGGVEQIKELHREARSFVWIEQFFKDLRYAWGNLLRNPGFTLTAVLALALGIGVNATIFGIYNAVALKQLPVADPSSVMRVKRWFGQNAYAYQYTFAYPEYRYLRDHNRVFSGVTAATTTFPVLASFGSKTTAVPEHLNGYAVSANYFADLGVNAHIGRTFLPDEDRSPGANAVVVLSYRFWQRKFQGDPNVIGQTIKLNSLPYTIVGVAPQGFSGTDTAPTDSGFWAPLSMLDQLQPEFGPASASTWREQWRDSNHPGFQILARLKDGVSREKAQAETDLLIHQYLAGYRESQPTLSVTLQRTSYFSSAGDFGMKVFAAVVLMVVSLVLVVACANVANMLLARGVARRREIGIRLALGASRGRVIRQLLTESILLSLLGGAAGILLSAAASKLLWVSLITVIPSFQQFLVELDVSPDAHVLVYGIVLSIVTGILFGLAPALQSTRSGLYSATQAAGSPSRLRGLLLGIQVAVSVLLLIVSGGLLGSIVSSFAKASDLGYETRNTYLVRGNFGSDRTKAGASVQRLRDRLETMPEVSSVAMGQAPLSGGFQFPMTAGRWKGQATTTWASDAYFETLGIPILEGRGFTRLEGDRDAPVAMISESTARRVWPGEDPLGKRLTLELIGTVTDYQVVGVVKDVRYTVITEIDPLLVFLPNGAMSRFRGGILFRIRGNRDKALVAVQSSAESVVDPAALATLDLVSLEDGSVAIQRGILRVLGAFAGTLTLLSLTLAGVGIYGVMAFLVSQRTSEIGIRMALGATSRAVIRNVMLQGVWPVLVGTLIGVLGSLALERAPILQGARQFIQSPPTFSDPVFYAELALVFAIVVLASLIPARRALRVDPAVALRHE